MPREIRLAASPRPGAARTGLPGESRHGSFGKSKGTRADGDREDGGDQPGDETDRADYRDLGRQ